MHKQTTKASYIQPTVVYRSVTICHICVTHFFNRPNNSTCLTLIG